MGLDYDEVSKTLTSNSIEFDEDDSLATIAKKNKQNPSSIYKLIAKETAAKKTLTNTPTKEKTDIPSSLGRKTLQELSDMQKIDLQKSISLLKEKGLADINAQSKIKNIADELSIMPIDVYKLLRGE
jgi:hypothetical protein